MLTSLAYLTAGIAKQRYYTSAGANCGSDFLAADGTEFGTIFHYYR
jgi:hypothetical protein